MIRNLVIATLMVAMLAGVVSAEGGVAVPSEIDMLTEYTDATAEFECSPTRVATGATVTCYDASNNEADAWLWSWGDRSVQSYGNVAAHIYDAPGVYDIRMMSHIPPPYNNSILIKTGYIEVVDLNTMILEWVSEIRKYFGAGKSVYIIAGNRDEIERMIADYDVEIAGDGDV